MTRGKPNVHHGFTSVGATLEEGRGWFVATMLRCDDCGERIPPFLLQIEQHRREHRPRPVGKPRFRSPMEGFTKVSPTPDEEKTVYGGKANLFYMLICDTCSQRVRPRGIASHRRRHADVAGVESAG